MTKHILVLDDNEMTIQLMRLILSRLGYRVTLKSKPSEALDWLQVPGNLPDLIISDVMMPGMTGQEFLRRVRRDPLTAHVPVIMVTAYEDKDQIADSFEAGADDYMIKPIDANHLDLRIRALLARSQPTTPPE